MRATIFICRTSLSYCWIRTQASFAPGRRSAASRDLTASRVSIGTGLIGTAAQKKRPLYVPDFAKETRYQPWGKKTRSELAIPLMVRDEMVGVLDCQSENPDHFDSETVDLLTLFSTQASMALQNARLYSLERRRASQLEAINTVARETTVVLDVKELLSKACQKIRQAFEVSHVSMLVKEDEDLVLQAHHGDLTLRIPEGGKVPAGAGLWGRALRESKTVIENDVEADPDFVGIYLEAGSRMCIPLVSFGQTLGVLVLDSARAGFLHGQRYPVAGIRGRHLRHCNPECSLRGTSQASGLSGWPHRNLQPPLLRTANPGGTGTRPSIRHPAWP